MDDRDTTGVVDPQWRTWVAENLARGATRAELIDALIDADVPDEHARACVQSIAESPALATARSLARRVAALEQIVRLRAEHRAVRGAIERVTLPSADEFLARFWVPGVPAIFTDVVTRWPAFGRWSPRDFAARFGDLFVEVCVGRSASPDPDVLWEGLRRELTMAEFVRALEENAITNDAYMTTNNGALRRPGLRALLDEIVVPPEIFGASLDPRCMGLWFGAAGTHTTMHHDHANSMLCQVVGRKRFRLAPPESLAMLEHARGVYSDRDPREEDAADLLEVVLAPGEALFLPTGWWHQVDALDLAISVSIRAFAWPNDYGWYRPGTALAGRTPKPG